MRVYNGELYFRKSTFLLMQYSSRSLVLAKLIGLVDWNNHLLL